MDHAVSPNRQQAGTNRDLPAHGIDPIGPWVDVNAFRRDGLCIFPALEEDTEDPQNVELDNGLNNQNLDHVVPGLDPPAGDEDAANEHLQLIEQEDSRAVRRILGQRMSGNAITARYCWQVLKQLRDILPKEGSPRMPNGPRQDYARILERLARMMTIPDEQDYRSALGVHPLGYECAFKVLQDMTPNFSCPLDYGECLDRLSEDLTATSSVMRVAEGIYVFKDREQYARRLRALAALL